VDDEMLTWFMVLVILAFTFYGKCQPKHVQQQCVFCRVYVSCTPWFTKEFFCWRFPFGSILERPLQSKIHHNFPAQFNGPWHPDFYQPDSVKCIAFYEWLKSLVILDYIVFLFKCGVWNLSWKFEDLMITKYRLMDAANFGTVTAFARTSKRYVGQ